MPQAATSPTPTPMTAGVVLCGGASERMGRAKALLPWRDRTLIEHVVGILAEATDEVVVVTAGEDSTRLDLPDLPARIVYDRVPELGPLAGIREGLEAIQAPLAYVTSTDAPFLTSEFVRNVLSHGRTAAVVNDGFTQPLAAAYERRLASRATQLLDDDRRRPLFLLQAGDYLEISTVDLPTVEPLRNLNTPDAYFDAVRDDYASRGKDIPPVVVEFFGIARERAGVALVEVAPATLRTVLAAAGGAASCSFTVDDPAYLFSLNGRQFLRQSDIPIGPGESVVVMDAAAGG